MVRVLHIIYRLDGGGASRSLITMGKYSARAGGFRHRVVSLCPGAERFIETARRAQITVLDAPKLETISREVERADIVQVHFWNTPKLYELLRSELPAMRLMIRLNVGGEHPPQVLTDELVKFADVIAASSPHTLRLQVCERLSPPHRRQRLSHLVPAADFERLEGLNPSPHAGFNVGYIGTVDFAKLHPDYVRMSAAIRVPEARFIVCGGGAAEHILVHQAERHGIADRLELRGYVEDIRGVLEELDVFGYPLCENNYSGADATLHEAMFAGVPPVIYAHGGTQHSVVHDRTGLIVHDQAGYQEAIERLFREPDTRARLGASARTYARRHFGAENSVEQLHFIYRRLLDQPKCRRPWPKDLPATGAERFVESLGDRAGAFRLSLRSHDTLEQLDAESIIAGASPVVLSPGGGGVLHYRNHYRRDPHLRLWSGLALERQGQHIRALAEYRSARELGCDHPRLLWYQARVAARVDAKDLVVTNLRRVVREAPEIRAAAEMLDRWEAVGRG